MLDIHKRQNDRTRPEGLRKLLIRSRVQRLRIATKLDFARRRVNITSGLVSPQACIYYAEATIAVSHIIALVLSLSPELIMLIGLYCICVNQYLLTSSSKLWKAFLDGRHTDTRT